MATGQHGAGGCFRMLWAPWHCCLGGTWPRESRQATATPQRPGRCACGSWRLPVAAHQPPPCPPSSQQLRPKSQWDGRLLVQLSPALPCLSLLAPRLPLVPHGGWCVCLRGLLSLLFSLSAPAAVGFEPLILQPCRMRQSPVQSQVQVPLSRIHAGP